MTLEDVDGLETAIEVAEKIGRYKDLQTELREARQLLVRLYRLKKAVSEVSFLDLCLRYILAVSKVHCSCVLHVGAL